MAALRIKWLRVNEKQSMKMLALFFGLFLLSCSGGGVKYGESGDDNSHLRNPQDSADSIVKISTPDSILRNDQYYYRLESDLMLNGMFVLDSFSLKRCILSIAKPDSVHKVGREIKEKFGVDYFDIYIGKSSIHAGNGQILSFKIRDSRLKLYTIGVGSTRAFFERIMKINFPDKDTIECSGLGDCFYSFRFKNDKIIEIDYHYQPL